ncbi:MAG: type II toxin-antitoxin system Phd/YefM family antitoxin [Planctomycetes bacterium]|nr:type II toxin-antitoxin system Phd/YefM family antitoxin [Planctomycetota bacterium]
MLPYEEFLEIQERLADAEDLLELRRAKAENEGQVPVPLDDVRRRFGLTD